MMCHIYIYFWKCYFAWNGTGRIVVHVHWLANVRMSFCNVDVIKFVNVWMFVYALQFYIFTFELNALHAVWLTSLHHVLQNTTIWLTHLHIVIFVVASPVSLVAFAQCQLARQWSAPSAPNSLPPMALSSTLNKATSSLWRWGRHLQSINKMSIATRVGAIEESKSLTSWPPSALHGIRKKGDCSLDEEADLLRRARAAPCKARWRSQKEAR